MRAQRTQLKRIEDLGAAMEERLILDNRFVTFSFADKIFPQATQVSPWIVDTEAVCRFRYTEHSTVGLAQQWDQLDQLGMRMQHNLEQQIQAWYGAFISFRV